MLFIDNKIRDIYFNLAAEEYLLKNCIEDVLMLWQSDNAVVLGKHQDVQAEIDVDFVKAKHINIARRYSGGGAVYQDSGNMNLTFIENTTKINFDKYTKQLIAFLSSMGICAQSDVRLGIYIDNLKISGSAQAIHKNRVMYHCTLLYSTDLDILVSSLEGNSGKCENDTTSKRSSAVRSVKSKATNIREHLQHSSDMDNFRQLILDYFSEKVWNKQNYDLNEDDMAAIEQLKSTKYALSDWILRGAYKKA